MFLRIAIVILGLGMTFVGVIGFLRPEGLAEGLALSPETPAGLGSVRALVGAHYLAMGLTAIYAAIRGHWAWLVPLATIEGLMVVARIVSLALGEADDSAVRTLVMETVTCLVLALGAILPARAAR